MMLPPREMIDKVKIIAETYLQIANITTMEIQSLLRRHLGSPIALLALSVSPGVSWNGERRGRKTHAPYYPRQHSSWAISGMAYQWYDRTFAIEANDAFISATRY